MEKEIDKNDISKIDKQEQRDYVDKLVTHTANTNINTNLSHLESPKKNKM